MGLCQVRTPLDRNAPPAPGEGTGQLAMATAALVVLTPELERALELEVPPWLEVEAAPPPSP